MRSINYYFRRVIIAASEKSKVTVSAHRKKTTLKYVLFEKLVGAAFVETKQVIYMITAGEI